MPFKLSASLRAHKSDVRAVLAPSSTHVVSASRDASAISWLRPTVASSFSPQTVYHAGERFVNALAWLLPSKEAPEGLVVTGGQDAIINLFQPSSSEPSFSLLGHEDNVCALHTSPEGSIISGSWDRTARVWKEFQEAYVLRGHSQAVWAVLALSGDEYLTGSADRSIKLWHGRKNVHTYSGHSDAVRGLAGVEGLGFASCSNDAEVRIWSMDGETLQVLSGHTSFVYSLAVLPSGLLLSSSEDRSVRVWRDGECIQTIVHPAISIWSVAAMPNGDFVTGASDGTVRIFSAAEERWASQEDLKTYDDSVQSQTLPSQQIGDVKKTDLPGSEVLDRPGNKEGQVVMVRNGDIVEAHQWSNAAQSWTKIGEVVDAVGSGRKQLHNGKEYDYVFDVDVQEGAPPLKLPYNASENPYSAAQRFLAANDLPPSYLDQVVQFIEKNTEGVSLGGGQEFVDPYTGATRYQPGRASTTVPTNSEQLIDPFTGASRYLGSASTSTPAAVNTGEFVDPFTGASRYSGATAAATASKSSAAVGVLPIRAPLLFKQANVPAVRTKVHQLNAALGSQSDESDLQMTEEDIGSISRILDFLSSTPPAGDLRDGDSEALLRIAARWPEGSRFPLIDTVRLLCAHSPSSLPPSVPFVHALLDVVQWDQPQASNKARDTNAMLALRAIANLGGKDGGSQTWARLAGANYDFLGKAQRTALATVALNASCELLIINAGAEISTTLLRLIRTILEKEQADTETVYRATVAAGNILFLPSADASIARTIQAYTAPIAGRPKDDRVETVLNEINKLAASR